MVSSATIAEILPIKPVQGTCRSRQEALQSPSVAHQCYHCTDTAELLGNGRDLALLIQNNDSDRLNVGTCFILVFMTSYVYRFVPPAVRAQVISSSERGIYKAPSAEALRISHLRKAFDTKRTSTRREEGHFTCSVEIVGYSSKDNKWELLQGASCYLRSLLTPKLLITRLISINKTQAGLITGANSQ